VKLSPPVEADLDILLPLGPGQLFKETQNPGHRFELACRRKLRRSGQLPQDLLQPPDNPPVLPVKEESVFLVFFVFLFRFGFFHELAFFLFFPWEQFEFPPLALDRLHPKHPRIGLFSASYFR